MINNKKIKIYFVGIGGIGMSGIAELMNEIGYTVLGSDKFESDNVKRLKKIGINVKIGNDKKNLTKVNAVVFSSAISQKNPEIQEAKKKHIPIVSRADMLSELMKNKKCIAVAGSHGKTTTTSMVGNILESGKLDPTIVNGGIINSLSKNNKFGKGNWMVVEADESDGSFAKLNPTVAIITNIDLEHLDYHKSEENLEKAFFQFVSSIPFYGFVCLCIDHPRTQKLISKLQNKKVITYGLSANADIRATNISYKDNKMSFLLNISTHESDNIKDIKQLFYKPVV